MFIINLFIFNAITPKRCPKCIKLEDCMLTAAERKKKKHESNTWSEPTSQIMAKQGMGCGKSSSIYKAVYCE